MKAFLLAAGKGTRLRPYTDTHPKCLIPILGRSLLDIWITLLEHHHVDEVLINTHHHAAQVEAFLRQRRSPTRMGLHAVFEPRLLGSAGTLVRNRRFVAGEKAFIIAYADNLTNLNITKMIDFHEDIRSMGGILTMGLFHAPDPSACGIATLDAHGRIVDFVEKPDCPGGDLANGGVYIAGPEIFDYVDPVRDGSDAVFDLGHDLLPRLNGKMYGYPIEEYLRDIGTLEAYQRALAEWPRQEQLRVS
jgi:mannose-1-phosphate guanylyltransferase